MLYQFLKNYMLRYPNKTLQDGQETITYKELLDYAECFGESLHDQKYGILCKSELSTAKAIMACLYREKTCVPLSYRYGEKHSQKIIDSIRLSKIITDNGIIQLSNDKEEVEDLSDVPFVLCTSGTTGMPKGTMLTNNNIIANLKDIHSYMSTNETDRILIVRPLYHCSALLGEFFTSLLNGLDIVFYNGEFNPFNIVETIGRDQITVLHGTPTMFYHLCNMAKRQQGVNLKVITMGGECITPVIARSIREVMPDVKVYNAYGLTETCARMTYLKPELFDQYPVSVGTPQNSMKVKLLNKELLISGKYVMKGYYNRIDETNRIIKDGWLYTGDIAEIDENGLIYIKCRKDNLIIRAGMNIYPQEIENALKQDERIMDAVAYGKRDEQVGQRIKLKVIADTLTKSELLSLCQSTLPAYQYPDTVEIVSEISKTGSGKIIRPKCK